MQARDAAGVAGSDHAFGQFHVRALKAVRAAGVENADEVDHRICAGEFLAQHLVVIDVRGADDDIGQHAQRTMLLAVAAQHHDVVAVGGESGNEVAADETGAAEDDDFLCGHGCESCDVSKGVDGVSKYGASG